MLDAFARRRPLAALLLILLLIVPGLPTPQLVSADPPGETAVVALPVNGRLLSETLGAFDEALLDFMATHEIAAATFGLSRDGVILIERGYGWLNEERTTPLPHDALMRIASITKPITAAAVRVLIDEGHFSLDSFAFDLGQPEGGVLPVEPFPSLGDERAKSITIEHLLRHRGGWDRSEAGDLTYREVRIARDMEIDSPPGRTNTMRWILGQPLQFDPGERSAYSNVGYLALGLIVEHVTGRDLIDVIHERVLGPLGVEPTEHRAGRTFREHCDPREPYYDVGGERVVNVHDPDGERIVRSYGGWDHEARIGQGGQITTTRALLHFLEARQIGGANIGALRDRANEGASWRLQHSGSLPGTNAIARQRGDGICYVVIFNKRPSGGTAYSTRIRNVLDELIDNGGIDWPEP